MVVATDETGGGRKEVFGWRMQTGATVIEGQNVRRNVLRSLCRLDGSSEFQVCAFVEVSR